MNICHHKWDPDLTTRIHSKAWQFSRASITHCKGMGKTNVTRLLFGYLGDVPFIHYGVQGEDSLKEAPPSASKGNGAAKQRQSKGKAEAKQKQSEGKVTAKRR